MFPSPSTELASVGTTDNAYAECYGDRSLVSIGMSFVRAITADDEKKNNLIQLE